MGNMETYRKAFRLSLGVMALHSCLPTPEMIEALGISKEEHIDDLRAAALLLELTADDIPACIRRNINEMSPIIKARALETLRNRADALGRVHSIV